MTFKEVILAVNGLRERDKMFEAWIRRATFIIAATNFGGKSVIGKQESLWPTGEKDSTAISDRALDQLRKFREAEALQRAKQKLDGGRAETHIRGGNKAG